MAASADIYLDHAAGTPVSDLALRAMEPYWQDRFHNPSSITLDSLRAREAVDQARRQIAKPLGAKPHQIVFTSGATEANNLAVRGAMQLWPGKTVLVSAIEHESVLEPAAEFTRRLIPVKPSGEIDLNVLEGMIDDDVVLVSLIHASNEIGTIQPMSKVSGLLARLGAARAQRGIGTPLLFHTDAAQSPVVLDLHAGRLGVDMMTLSAAKIYGPKGAGCLYVRDHSLLKAQHTGGGQEGGLRSGTPPVPLIAGFGAAFEVAAVRREKRQKQFEDLRQYALAELQRCVPSALLNVEARQCLPHILNLQLPGRDGEAVVMALDQRGIQAATGSACAASSDLPSHVLLALGLTPSAASASLRLSFGEATTKAQLRRTAETLAEALHKLDAAGRGQ